MRRRQAFTIVELLVSLALILFIMAILSEAFSSGLETFRQLKAIGDLQERLRTATTILRRDLAADHFEGHRRLGDPTFWADGYPVMGYFRFDGGASFAEGADPDITFNPPNGYFVSPVRSPPPPPPGQPQFPGQLAPGGHTLAFTVRLRGNGRENFFSAPIPPPLPRVGANLTPSPLVTQDTTFYGYSATPDAQFQDVSLTYNSQWAEVVYFLVWNGTYAGNTPLYTLYRSQLAVVPDNRKLAPNAPPIAPDAANAALTTEYNQGYYKEVSCFPAPNTPFLFFPCPGDLTNPGSRALANRGPFTAANNPMNNPSQWGATLVLNDVISFDVRALPYLPGTNPPLQPYFNDFVTLNGGYNNVQVNQAQNAAGITFDTADPKVYTGNPYSTVPTPGYVVRALQISVRIWDLKTQQTRQTSVIQDM
jgi:type II secretory pathway pseudopilin PulG